jgi:hypothetical protein
MPWFVTKAQDCTWIALRVNEMKKPQGPAEGAGTLGLQGEKPQVSRLLNLRRLCAGGGTT